MIQYEADVTITGGFYKGKTGQVKDSICLGLLYVVTIDHDNVFRSKVAILPFWRLKAK